MQVLLQQVPLVITPALNGYLTNLEFRVFQTQLACLDFARLNTSAKQFLNHFSAHFGVKLRQNTDFIFLPAPSTFAPHFFAMAKMVFRVLPGNN